MLRRLVLAAALLVLAVLGVLLVRGASVRSATVAALPAAPIQPDAAATAQRLAAALRFPTVSHLDSVRMQYAPFDELDRFLLETYPRVFAALDREPLDSRSLLLRWRGRDPAAKAVLFAAHLDVVPVEPGSHGDWTHPPFAGVVAGGYVWGRGSIDDKLGVVALLEAVDGLLAGGFQPAMDVYLGFGHDEEIAGLEGAARIAAHLRARGVRLEFVLDEGFPVLDGVIPGLRRPVAVVGVAERGYATIVLEAQAAGGHSSLPTTTNPAAAIAAALVRIGDAPPPAVLVPAARAMLEALAPESRWFGRLFLANLWLTEPLVVRALARQSLTRAMVQTSVTPTRLAAGDKENVIPQRASAHLNVRALPGEPIEAIRRHVEAAVADPAIRVSVLEGQVEGSATASRSSRGYRTVAGAIATVFPDAAIVPGLLIATTDSGHYADLADDLYRFQPVRAGAADLARYHGTDERVAISDLGDAIRYYATVLAALH